MSIDDTARIDQVMALVRAELVKATSKFAPFNSAHEGYAVILEEVDELWDEVKANQPVRAAEEAVQVAAMGARFLLDLGGATQGQCPRCASPQPGLHPAVQLGGEVQFCPHSWHANGGAS